MAVASGRRRLDVGRLVMVPAAAVILLADVAALGHGGGSGAAGALRLIGEVLVIAFYALMIWCYLRRDQAVATSSSVTAHAAAVAATWLPFVLPLLHGTPPGPVRQAVSDLLLMSGMAWAVWSLHVLGRNVSVLAQARDVVDRGPYRWVRHPLYVGEIVSSLGVVIGANSVVAVAVWLVLCGLQVYRALREEQTLLQALPGYRDYRSRTAALLPGLL
ncbi:MAG TPA: isoprenylcysteine carboxylmethyltransferase family protein [Streptosporangiaceae bacterium]|nr:isoprenylcysteine carboxylmethyltransferase family protein [Streptosporangiaceae bacterium]